MQLPMETATYPQNDPGPRALSSRSGAADVLSSRIYGGAYGPVGPAPVIVGTDYDAYDAVAPGPVFGYGYGPVFGYGYGYVGPAWRAGSYYSYGAGRANPSLSPNGWDQDNPRDQQLQGHN